MVCVFPVSLPAGDMRNPCPAPSGAAIENSTGSAGTGRRLPNFNSGISRCPRVAIFRPCGSFLSQSPSLAGFASVAGRRFSPGREPHFRSGSRYSRVSRGRPGKSRRTNHPGALRNFGTVIPVVAATTVSCRSLVGPEPPRRWQAMESMMRPRESAGISRNYGIVGQG